MRAPRPALREFPCSWPTPCSLMADTHVGRTPRHIQRDRQSLTRKHMTTNLPEKSKAQLTPETDRDAELSRPPTGMAPNEKTRATWEEGNKDSGRPPWGWLLVGIAALSAVYWLWGRESVPLRASTPPQLSAITREVLSTIPTVSLPDGIILSLPTTGYGQENLLVTNEAGDGRATNHRLELGEKK